MPKTPVEISLLRGLFAGPRRARRRGVMSRFPLTSDQEFLDVRDHDVVDAICGLARTHSAERLISLTPRELWGELCQRKGVIAHGSGKQAVEKRPSASQRSMISRRLSELRRHLSGRAGMGCHDGAPAAGRSHQQAAVALVRAYGSAERVLAEYDRLQHFVEKAGSLRRALQDLRIADEGLRSAQPPVRTTSR